MIFILLKSCSFTGTPSSFGKNSALGNSVACLKTEYSQIPMVHHQLSTIAINLWLTDNFWTHWSIDWLLSPIDLHCITILPSWIPNFIDTQCVGVELIPVSAIADCWAWRPAAGVRSLGVRLCWRWYRKPSAYHRKGCDFDGWSEFLSEFIIAFYILQCKIRSLPHSWWKPCAVRTAGICRGSQVSAAAVFTAPGVPRVRLCGWRCPPVDGALPLLPWLKWGLIRSQFPLASNRPYHWKCKWNHMKSYQKSEFFLRVWLEKLRPRKNQPDWWSFLGRSFGRYLQCWRWLEGEFSRTSEWATSSCAADNGWLAIDSKRRKKTFAHPHGLAKKWGIPSIELFTPLRVGWPPTPQVFWSVTGAKQFTHISVVFFWHLCMLFASLIQKASQPSAARAAQGYDFPPPLGILPMGAFLPFSPRGDLPS